MVIRSLKLKNYRNYEDLSVEFGEGTNILYGRNAQGKTNVLEAVYVCSTTKSHRGSRDKELIRFGQENAHIRLQLEKKNTNHQIDMHLKRTKAKGVAIDGLVAKRSSELFGVVNVVFFSPEDLSIIKSGPGMRRRFIDMELCQLDQIYLHNLSQYQKTLDQRNSLFKQIAFKPSLTETLEVWNSQMVRYGREVILARKKFVQELNAVIQPIHEKLSGQEENLELIYEPSADEDRFSELLVEKQETDLKLKTTTVGPHRDDLIFMVNGIDIRKFGSQGQQRTAALSLKLAEIELVRRKILDTPILLLDDVLSELDAARQTYLLESINGIQTILTCTGLDEFEGRSFTQSRIFYVENGNLKLMEQ